MIVYQSTKKEFVGAVHANEVHETIKTNYFTRTGHQVSPQEFKSWEDSMHYMGAVMNDPDIPDDVGISIEFHIPQTAKRIDFIVTGQDQGLNEQLIIIELKGWEAAERTQKDAIVRTRFKGGLSD
ncbi:MAG: AAA family ATPase, partial [Burkholderiales bacterium]